MEVLKWILEAVLDVTKPIVSLVERHYKYSFIGLGVAIVLFCVAVVFGIFMLVMFLMGRAGVI